MKEKGRDEKRGRRLSIFESTVFSTILPPPFPFEESGHFEGRPDGRPGGGGDQGPPS